MKGVGIFYKKILQSPYNPIRRTQFISHRPCLKFQMASCKICETAHCKHAADLETQLNYFQQLLYNPAVLPILKMLHMDLAHPISSEYQDFFI